MSVAGGGLGRLGQLGPGMLAGGSAKLQEKAKRGLVAGALHLQQQQRDS